MRNTSVAEMVAELQALLLEGQASLVRIVTGAARVAHLSDEPEFAALFELHLDGIPSKDGARRRACYKVARPDETAPLELHSRVPERPQHARWNVPGPTP
jgi:hypothetical protein